MSPIYTEISPYTCVVAGAVTYSSVLASLHYGRKSDTELRKLIKAVSAGHSIASTSLTLLALSQKWSVSVDDASHQVKISQSRLDDSSNPLIEGQNQLADSLTAWEAGYLIYDTGALFFEAYSKQKKGPRRAQAALGRLLKTSPIFLVHHIALIGALMYLQTYIAAERAKGLRVIMAFLLMNASTPLLHLRWWLKRSTGRRDVRADAALAIVFALTRFGSVYWVMNAYGKHHGLNAWEAFTKQRWQCKTGTGLLTGVNALWWLGLVRQMARVHRE